MHFHLITGNTGLCWGHEWLVISLLMLMPAGDFQWLDYVSAIDLIHMVLSIYVMKSCRLPLEIGTGGAYETSMVRLPISLHHRLLQLGM